MKLHYLTIATKPHAILENMIEQKTKLFESAENHVSKFCSLMPFFGYKLEGPSSVH